MQMMVRIPPIIGFAKPFGEILPPADALPDEPEALVPGAESPAAMEPPEPVAPAAAGIEVAVMALVRSTLVA